MAIREFAVEHVCPRLGSSNTRVMHRRSAQAGDAMLAALEVCFEASILKVAGEMIDFAVDENVKSTVVMARA